MEYRDCRSCAMVRPHEKIERVEQRIAWTVYVCIRCGTISRVRSTPV